MSGGAPDPTAWPAVLRRRRRKGNNVREVFAQGREVEDLIEGGFNG